MINGSDGDESVTQRGQAIAEAKRKQMEKRRAERRKTQKKKVAAKVALESGSTVTSFVYDISEGGTSIITAESLLPNTWVNITIEHSTPFSVRARVVWSQRQTNDGHIISANPMNFRSGLEFKFDQPEEKNSVLAFFESLSIDG